MSAKNSEINVRLGKIVILGTGGTIAGHAVSASDNIGYTAAQVGVAELLSAVPGLQDFPPGSLEAEQVAQLDSKDMDFDVCLKLAQRVAHHLARSDVQGVVITHGTDTLEETAWFLQRVLGQRCAHKPVVLACAMRPASSSSPDGPQNLQDAIAVARATAVGSEAGQMAICGVVAVCAGTVHSALAVQKLHPYRLDAFGSGDNGPIGFVEENTLRLVQKPQDAIVDIGVVAINLEAVNASKIMWPWVEIVTSHAHATGRGVDALVAAGVEGIVVAATGNGTVHHALEAALLRAQTAGVKVLRSTRCAQGRVLAKPGDVLADSQGLSPVKARIELVLALLAQSGIESHAVGRA